MFKTLRVLCLTWCDSVQNTLPTACSKHFMFCVMFKTLRVLCLTWWDSVQNTSCFVPHQVNLVHVQNTSCFVFAPGKPGACSKRHVQNTSCFVSCSKHFVFCVTPGKPGACSKHFVFCVYTRCFVSCSKHFVFCVCTR
jgi:hypothetical protein